MRLNVNYGAVLNNPKTNFIALCIACVLVYLTGKLAYVSVSGDYAIVNAVVYDKSQRNTWRRGTSGRIYYKYSYKNQTLQGSEYVIFRSFHPLGSEEHIFIRKADGINVLMLSDYIQMIVFGILSFIIVRHLPLKS